MHYPPNPYHRVDCRPTRRRLQVRVAGDVLVDTDDTVIVFETALAPRLYVAPEHVRTDLLRRTDTSSYCNYKGYATYWAAGDVEDVGWSYDEPLPETRPIAGYFSFDGERAEVKAELPSQIAGLERVALFGGVTGLIARGEPFLSFGRRTVGPLFGIDPPGGLLLDTVVAH